MPSAETVATAPLPTDLSRETIEDTLRRATLGEYEILGVLGRGGMATVYLAHDLSLDRKVAIKVLSPALFHMGEGMVERFKREARTAAALSHPHIIPIYAVKETHQTLYFVMKYVAGRPLDAVINTVGRLPIKMVQTILGHVGDALAYAHRHRVIHRDIKSANIMIDEDGWAVVTDFGIAKVEEAQGLTLTGVTVGTPAYMSPEQCATREVTGASDQYSLGVVAYEMLTGKLPFQSESSMTVMYAHFNQRPHELTELRSDCPTNLAAAVMRMLEKDPGDRWPTLDDVVACCGRPSLRRDDPVRNEMITLAKAGPGSQLLAGLTVPTSPIALARSSPPVRATRRVLRSWRGVGAVGIAVLLAAGVLVTAPWRLLRDRAAHPGDSVRAPTQPTALVTDTPVRPQRRDSAIVPAKRQRVARSTPRVAAAGARADSVPVVTPARQEDSVLSSLRVTALAALRRAVDAGATPADLARGDTMLRGADSLVARGRTADAMVQLVTATSAWTDAERLARARVAAARDTVRPVVAAPPADPRVQIEATMAAYARALESRDTGQVRRVYPGLSASQQRGWEDFFRSVRNLKANLRVTTVNVQGEAADAVVDGVYEFDNATTGRVERRPVTFHASFVSDSAGWRLSAIR
ncbi:MAG TPA: protein kinase [Gemmatimonadales bacterium]|nr:protein kinase [Gemmatimonadales bacterium]